MPTYRLDLAYDGTGFHGYARQPDVRTVQGELEDALFKHTGPVTTSVAGRTDAGVHARLQTVSLEAAGLEPDRLLRSLNSQLGPEIAVMAVVEVGADFDARFSALSRRYRYFIHNVPVLDPRSRLYAWHVPDRLDVERLNEAASHFVGAHDFASFCRAAEGKTTTRTVLEAGWTASGPQVVFEVRALAFCHQMVRSMVALCTEVGRGRFAAGDVPAVLAAHDRNAARGAAPPHGLVLWDVEYPA